MKRKLMPTAVRPGCGLVMALLTCFLLSACERRSGEAIVLSKEHIPVAEATPTPSAKSEPATASPVEEEIVTEDDGPDMRGTSRDPRAVDHEQWLAKVQMVSDRRRVDLRVDQRRWTALKVGDRVRVSYKVGKYTGTIWSSDLE